MVQQMNLEFSNLKDTDLQKWIVSPSGNFYGSEQTLLNYLQLTSLSFEVFVPSNSSESFLDALMGTNKHRITKFDSANTLYLRLTLRLLSALVRNLQVSLYVNEAGHIRYVNVLNLLFPHLRAIIHVRLVEDVYSRPWNRIRSKGLHILSTSSYIQNSLKSLSVSSTLLSSPFRLEQSRFRAISISCDNFIVVSRLSKSKGSDFLCSFLRHCDDMNRNVNLFHYGEVNEDAAYDLAKVQQLECINWHAEGFEESKYEIYSKGVLLHLNPREPLGVVLLESVSFGVPFLSFNSGGTGEIARNMGLEKYTCDPTVKAWEEELLLTWDRIRSLDKVTIQKELESGFTRGQKYYNPYRYKDRIDRLILH